MRKTILASGLILLVGLSAWGTSAYRIIGPASISGTLNVTGASSLGAISAGSGTFSSTITAPSFASNSATVASAGKVRLGDTEGVSWRNHADSGDLSLVKTTADALSYGGTSFLSSVGALLGNAPTASALAANPGDCSSNTYATTIAANGDLTCASITNAATTATASNSSSTIMLRDGSGQVAATTFTGALAGNASTATTATNQSGGTVAATTITASGTTTLSSSLSSPVVTDATASPLNDMTVAARRVIKLTHAGALTLNCLEPGANGQELFIYMVNGNTFTVNNFSGSCTGAGVGVATLTGSAFTTNYGGIHLIYTTAEAYWVQI